MSIEEAIKARYERFNRLWVKATGHSFEEDDKWCNELNEKEMKPWSEKLAVLLEKYGFKTPEDYHKSIEWVEGGINGDYRKNAIDELDNILKEKPNHSSLYPYEKFCIDEAARTANWIIENKGTEWWIENIPGKSIFDADTMLKEAGFVSSDVHSGNTFGMTIRFVDCLLRRPELFQYMHGALTPLVGDEGYHDDRSDLPKED